MRTYMKQKIALSLVLMMSAWTVVTPAFAEEALQLSKLESKPVMSESSFADNWHVGTNDLALATAVAAGTPVIDPAVTMAMPQPTHMLSPQVQPQMQAPVAPAVDEPAQKTSDDALAPVPTQDEIAAPQLLKEEEPTMKTQEKTIAEPAEEVAAEPIVQQASEPVITQAPEKEATEPVAEKKDEPALSPWKSGAVSSPSIEDGAAVLHQVSGEVEVYNNARRRWIKGREGMVLRAGDRVMTKDNAFAIVWFDSKGRNSARLEKNSELVFKDMEPTTAYLNIGHILVKLDELAPGTTFKVGTNEAVTGVFGTVFEVVRYSQDETMVIGHEGTVRVFPVKAKDRRVEMRSRSWWGSHRMIR